MKELTEFLVQNFGYPYGGLYSNLIASAILAGLGYLWGRRAESNHERRHQEALEMHRKTHELLDKKKK